MGYSGDAFADTPTANSATVNFDATIGQATITWDFGTHSARDYCIVKTETHQFPLGFDPITANNSTLTTFLGTNTNTVYGGGMQFEDIFADSNKLTASTIACTGSMTYDIPTRFFRDDIQLFMTFGEVIKTANVAAHTGAFTSLDTIDYDEGGDLNTLHEVSIQYSNYIAFKPLQCGGDNRWEVGTEYFKDIYTEDTMIELRSKDICTQNNNGGSTNPDGSTVETTTSAIIPFPTTGDWHLLFPSSSTVGGSSGSSNDVSKTRPTFGLDHHTFAQIVEGGLMINNATFNVLDNYWTHIPMQNATVGEVQNFTATTYAPKTLKYLEFLFGVPEVGKWYDAESSIGVALDYQGVITSNYTYNRDDVLIDFDTLSYSASKTFCSPDDTTQLCDRVSFEFVFNESPLYQVLAVQAIDMKGRTNILYFNDGIDVTGESLNPPVQKVILSDIPHQGLQTVERVDKAEDIWMTLDENEPVSLYQQNSFGTFLPLEWKETEKLMDNNSSIMNRDHSYFDLLVQVEQKRAQHTLDNFVIR